MSLDHLGTPLRPMSRVHGKSSNRLYRLDTDQGSFAVKELNLVDRRWAYHAGDVFRFELAAFAAGIPMPEPISAGPGVLVHRGSKVTRCPKPRCRQHSRSRSARSLPASTHSTSAGPLCRPGPDATGLARARPAGGGDRTAVGRRVSAIT